MIKYTSNETVNWNQLIQNDFEAWIVKGTAVKNKENNSVHVITNSQWSGVVQRGVITKHKYYVKYDINVVTGKVSIWFGENRVDLNVGDNIKNYIRTASNDKIFEVQSSQSDYNCEFYINNVNFIDLTAIYGEGNEPTTVEQFKADYKSWFGKDLDYEPYAPIDTVRYKERYLKKRYIAFNPSDYDGIQGTVVKTSTALVPNNSMNWLRDTNGNLIFPDGMKKAGSVYDELKVENGVLKAIKRIGSVDLGTLDWERMLFNNVYYFEALKSDIKSTPASDIGNIITSKYNIDKAVIGSHADKTVALNTNKIRLFDFSYTTAAALKASLAGVMLYYELATPIEYTIRNIREVKQVYIGENLVWKNN